MKKRTIVIGAVLIAQLLGTPAAFAGPWEDGMAAYNRGDYVPAIRVFRALAEQGNAKAQNVLGVMFRKGEGVAKSPARAHMWFSLAAKRGEAGAKAELREVSRTMTAQEISKRKRWRKHARRRTIGNASIELLAITAMHCADAGAPL